MIWRIKQIEGNLGQGYGFLPSWITASEFSRSAKAILHIIQNPAEFNNCFIIHSKYFKVLSNLTSSTVDFPQTFACFLARPVCRERARARETREGWLLPLPSRVSFSRARFFLCPLLPSACYAGYRMDGLLPTSSKYGKRWLVVKSKPGSQWETTKYFEWIIITIFLSSTPLRRVDT